MIRAGQVGEAGGEGAGTPVRDTLGKTTPQAFSYVGLAGAWALP